MKTKTLSDHPLLIGQILAKARARELRRFKRRHSHKHWPYRLRLLAFLALCAWGIPLAYVLLHSLFHR